MKRQTKKSVPEKAKNILWGLLIVFGLITLRIGVLSTFLHHQKVYEAKKPQKRKVIDKAQRASICDRFGHLLATNQIQYNAGVCYSHLRQIPRLVTQRSEKGRKIKTYPRKEYITQLSKLLAEHLQLDAERVEDLIYSKAAILGAAPFILKENIDENIYFRLKILEKDWPGIITETAAKRIYPKGFLAAETIGYIGPISREKYESILEEMKLLKDALEEDPSQELLQTRLTELEKLSYAINDLTGKVGIEAICDELLRGQSGKKVFLTDIKGNNLGELEESSASVPGKMIQLTLCAELQAYAEQLLAEYSQEDPHLLAALPRRQLIPPHRPWIKEGAIVVMDPKTGDVLTLASFPRYNPNDFSRSHLAGVQHAGIQTSRWLETPAYLGEIWDQKTPLIRERFDVLRGEFFEEEKWLDLPCFLNMILAKKSPLHEKFSKYATIFHATLVQQALEELLRIFEPLSARKIVDLLYSDAEHQSTKALITRKDKEIFEERLSSLGLHVQYWKGQLAPYFSEVMDNNDKLLLVDLYRLLVDPSRFTSNLMYTCQQLSLTDYKQLTKYFAATQTALKEIVQELFHNTTFKAWRADYSKAFLAKKRREERLAHKKYARPYLDYLDGEEQEQFDQFWHQHHLKLLILFLTEEAVIEPELKAYAQELKQWRQELCAGAHHALPWRGDFLRLYAFLNQKDSLFAYEFLQTLRPFSDLNRPLYGYYPQLRIDEQSNQRLERHLALSFYPRYGHGHLRSYAFRQATTIGSLYKLIPAYAALVQQYQAGTAAPLNPLTIIDDKHRASHRNGGWNVGFFTDGRPIPLYYHGGRLPKTDHAGVGRVDVIKALEASSNPYFSMLAGDVLNDPEDLCDTSRLFGFGEKTGIDLTGEYAGSIPKDVAYNKTGLYSMAIGQHTLLVTPLQAAVMLSSLTNGGRILKPRLLMDEPTICKWQLLLPHEVKQPLFEGMRRVIMGDKGTGRFVRSQFPSSIVSQTIGKTSTAEIMEVFGCDSFSRSVKIKDIWFGSIVFDPSDEGKMTNPELVIVVYLRHGEYGRLSVPYALKIAQKWREIKTKSKASKLNKPLT